MQVCDIMTPNVDCCTPETNLRDVARIMAEQDVGSIPVVQSHESMRPVGIITDRDITCRIVARGENPLQKSARDAMSSSVLTVRPDTNIEDCLRRMEEKQIRRVPVVDENGQLCGIVAQADIALKSRPEETAELVRDISQPSQGRQHVYHWRREDVKM